MTKENIHRWERTTDFESIFTLDFGEEEMF